MRRHHELPFGAELTAGGVRFRLWAPRAREVAVLLENERAPALPMVGEAEGWFSVTTGEAGPGSRYRYRVDGADYPDPASRHQPDGVHGASQVIDPGAYRWRDAKWQGGPWRAATWEARSSLRLAEGNASQAAALLREAATIFAESGRPLDKGRCIAAAESLATA